MATTAGPNTVLPHRSLSPLARTTSPYKDPRTPPLSLAQHTAKIWDEYERQAIENAKRRESKYGSDSFQASRSQRTSSRTVLDIIKSYEPHASPRLPASSPLNLTTASPQLGYAFQSPGSYYGCSDSTASTTVAICKTCKRGITSASGICEKCKKTIILPSQPRESTPPLTLASRNYGSTDLPKLCKESASISSPPSSSSPKRRSQWSSFTQFAAPPIRLSSLRPPPKPDTKASVPETSRTRKVSLTDPNEPFLRLQISRKPIPSSLPSSPTTPPSTRYTHAPVPNNRAQPSSLANVTTPHSTNSSRTSRHTSVTSSELSTTDPYTPTTTTSPPSMCRASYSLHNATSVWDEWDSDEEGKIGLVGYWKGRKWRGSRGSLGGTSASLSAGARRDSSGKEESVKEETKRKRRAFVRVISCGCGENE